MNNMNNNNHVIERASIVDIENDGNIVEIKLSAPPSPNSANKIPAAATTDSKAQLWCKEDDDEKTDVGNNDDDKNNDEKNKLNQKIILRVAFVTVGLSLIACVILVWYYMGWMYGFQAFAVAVIAIIIASGKYRWFIVAFKTAGRDISALVNYIKILIYIKRLARQNKSLGDVFVEHVQNQPEKACIIFEGRSWSFREINEYANRLANEIQSDGYDRSHVIGLFMENRPEFVATWLGLSKLGIVVPLINTNQRDKSLLHSINIANCNAVIFGESLREAMDEVLPELDEKIKLYQQGDKPLQQGGKRFMDLSLKMLTAKTIEPVVPVKVNHHDKLVYIYTSGTTGLPKAAVLNHARFVFIATGIYRMGGFKADDIFYTPLPLYHTAGGVMSIGQAILFGATVVIRKKFSASGYFPDCEKYNCTVAQYIGEMCRYMLATKPSSSDKNHKLRVIFGNGLRPQIWTQFVERFSIKNVVEFYGATEGNANITNPDNTVGAIGFVSRIIPQVYPISIIRADPLTGEPIRGPDGLCQTCKPNEPGVFIGKIVPGNASRQFLGYVDKKASEKKIVQNVFKKGDSAFLSGDILVADELGYLYFKDRTGDTFRWKGENVSTSEVEAYVSNAAEFRDTVVYGVQIPNVEGRAGMAAILDPEHQTDMTKFTQGITKSLPSYARPLFIRFLSKVDLTGTFKLKKLDLQNEGFDPTTIEDRLYYLTSSGKYEPLTKEIYIKINNGELRF